MRLLAIRSVTLALLQAGVWEEDRERLLACLLVLFIFGASLVDLK